MRLDRNAFDLRLVKLWRLPVGCGEDSGQVYSRPVTGFGPHDVMVGFMAQPQAPSHDGP